MTFISLPHLFSALVTTPLATTPFAVDSDGEIIVPLEFDAAETSDLEFAVNDDITYTAPSGKRYNGHVLEISFEASLYRPQYLAYIAYDTEDAGWMTGWVTFEQLAVRS